MHRLTLGDFELTIVSDGTYYLDGGAFFGIIPKVMWERKVKADEKNRVVTGLNSVLIRGGKKTVLIETGIGNKVPEKMVKIYAPQAKLLENLHAAGAAPEDIDLVINTHLHFDHCGWNTVRAGERVRATFPNAKYYVQEGEWRHGVEQHIRDRVSYISDNYDPLIKNGQMELLNGGREIVPGISVKVYPGHTRHMQAVMIESGGQKACYISDLIPTAAHLDIVWVMSYDLFPLDTIENKQRFYDEAVPQKWLVIFTHDHFTPWAYIEREGEKITAKPVAEAVPAD